jgi:hypothetical protein
MPGKYSSNSREIFGMNNPEKKSLLNRERESRG